MIIYKEDESEFCDLCKRTCDDICKNCNYYNIRYLPITKERTQHGIIHSIERIKTMTETVIIFICGMFAGILIEFIISAVVIMRGDK